jgi:hypothetical protein
MPTDSTALASPAARPAASTRHPLAARRILRLALGTALCLWFSQAVSWQLSYIAPVLTLLILALPLPPPGLRKGIAFVTALMAPMVAGMALLPFLWHTRWAGILLVGLALFASFLYSARGGSPVLGNFMTIGLTLVVTIGSVSPDLMIMLVQSLGVCAVAGLAFVWLAHLLLPDPPPDRSLPAIKPPKPPARRAAEARRLAVRSLFVVFPMALVFMFISGSASYAVVMIKVASLGQQATAGRSREMGHSLLESTFWGGVAAIIGWYALRIWPSLTLYTLLVALAGLWFGRGIFQGPAVGPKFSMWSYAFLTMLVILAPAVLDSPVSSAAGAAFWSRLWLIVLVAVYGTLAVWVFDAFWPAARPGKR